MLHPLLTPSHQSKPPAIQDQLLEPLKISAMRIWISSKMSRSLPPPPGAGIPYYITEREPSSAEAPPETPDPSPQSGGETPKTPSTVIPASNALPTVQDPPVARPATPPRTNTPRTRPLPQAAPQTVLQPSGSSLKWVLAGGSLGVMALLAAFLLWPRPAVRDTQEQPDRTPTPEPKVEPIRIEPIPVKPILGIPTPGSTPTPTPEATPTPTPEVTPAPTPTPDSSTNTHSGANAHPDAHPDSSANTHSETDTHPRLQRQHPLRDRHPLPTPAPTPIPLRHRTPMLTPYPPVHPTCPPHSYPPPRLHPPLPPATPAPATPTPAAELALSGEWLYEGGSFIWQGSLCKVNVAAGVQETVSIRQEGNQISVSSPSFSERSGQLIGNQLSVSGRIGGSGTPTVAWSGTVSPDGRVIRGRATCGSADFAIKLTRQS
jgi:hypothetical protein